MIDSYPVETKLPRNLIDNCFDRELSDRTAPVVIIR